MDWCYAQRRPDRPVSSSSSPLPKAVEDKIRAAWKTQPVLLQVLTARLDDRRPGSAPDALNRITEIPRCPRLSSPPAASRPAPARAATAVGDKIFAAAARVSGILVLILLGAIIVTLFIGGLPAFRAFGAGFLIDATGTRCRTCFGGAVPIYGTLITSVLALIFAVPVSFGIAFFLTELAPLWLRRPVGTAVELLAAVPSIIYGMWGFFVDRPDHGQLRAALLHRQSRATCRSSATCSPARRSAPASPPRR